MSVLKSRKLNLSTLDPRLWRGFAAVFPDLLIQVEPEEDDEDPAGMSLFKVISGGLRLSRRYQERMVATLLELRALSKEVGISAARPLHRSSPSTPRPDLGRYGIRLLGSDEACVDCGARMPAAGPIGWRRQDPSGPLCDPCLVEASPPLAAILTTINLLREVGWTECQRDEDEATVGGMVLTTARLHEESQLKGIPLRGLDIEADIIPALRRLDAAYTADEDEDEDDAVCH